MNAARLVTVRLAVAILLGGLAAAAGAQGVRVTIDRPEATVQDRLVLSVVVEGSQRAHPRLPDLPDFQVLSGGQTSQMRIVNNRTSVSVTYSFFLEPRHPGTFTIGPVTVEIEGRTYASQPFSVRILEASAQPRESQSVFITTEVSNDTPWVGEQVIYTWRFFRRTQINNAQLDPMEFDGFLTEDLGQQRNYETTRGGQRYVVSELRKALFPQEQGTLSLPPTQVRYEVVLRTNRRGGSVFDSFFGTRTEPRAARGPALEIDVRPLPAAPRGYSGLVGDFRIASQIKKRELRVGESATWILTVSGTGNVQMIGEPTLPQLEEFKIYDEKPTSSVNHDGRELTGSRSFSKALVPLVAGELTLPPVTLSYFDPQAGSYRTASTAPIALRVLPAEGKEDLRLTESLTPTGKMAVRILADDILPIYKDLDAVTPAPYGHRADPVWFATLLAPPLLYFGLVWVERRRRHFTVNVGLRRRQVALKRALKGLKEVDAAVRAGNGHEAAQLASRVLREYVGDKVDLEGSAFTPAEADAQLRRCGVEEELVGETHRRLEGLEASRYGGTGADESTSVPLRGNETSVPLRGNPTIVPLRGNPTIVPLRGNELVAELGPLLKKLERQIRVEAR